MENTSSQRLIKYKRVRLLIWEKMSLNIKTATSRDNPICIVFLKLINKPID